MKFTAIAYVPVTVEINEDLLPANKAEWSATAALALWGAFKCLGLTPQQITSIVCHEAPPQPDGTNGPRETMTDLLTSKAGR